MFPDKCFAGASLLDPYTRGVFSYECETEGVAGKGCWKLLKRKRETIGNFTTEFAESTESGGETDQSGLAATNTQRDSR